MLTFNQAYGTAYFYHVCITTAYCDVRVIRNYFSLSYAAVIRTYLQLYLANVSCSFSYSDMQKGYQHVRDIMGFSRMGGVPTKSTICQLLLNLKY